MAFPRPDDDAPPITVGEWVFLAIGTICMIMAIGAFLL